MPPQGRIKGEGGGRGLCLRVTARQTTFCIQEALFTCVVLVSVSLTAAIVLDHISDDVTHMKHAVFWAI